MITEIGRSLMSSEQILVLVTGAMLPRSPIGVARGFYAKALIAARPLT